MWLVAVRSNYRGSEFQRNGSCAGNLFVTEERRCAKLQVGRCADEATGFGWATRHLMSFCTWPRERAAGRSRAGPNTTARISVTKAVSKTQNYKIIISPK